MTDLAPGLSAYLRRIEVQGPLKADLPTLKRIHNAHVRSIPFENLAVVLKEQVSLQAPDVEDKLVRQEGGGYCFEHNGLLARMLRTIGFEVDELAGRARVGRERSHTPPRTHVWLRISIDGKKWMVDAGLGGLTPTMPLQWRDGAPQRTPHDMRRIICEHGRWFHQVHINGAWRDVCELLLEPMPAPDREVANWYTSQHPNSDFRSRLMAARATEHGRATLSNRSLTLRSHSSAERRELKSATSLRTRLAEHFGLQVSARQAEQLFAFACAQEAEQSDDKPRPVAVSSGPA